MSLVAHPESSHRSFIALDLPRVVRDELAAWLRRAQAGRELRAVKPRNMHLTLAFLGERDGYELDEVAGILDELVEAALRLAIGAPIWLPRRNPRALAVEVHESTEGDSGSLTQLQADLARSLTQHLDWRPPGTFRPHITLARLSRSSRPQFKPLPPTPQLVFVGESVSLYRSELRREGAEYEALRTWRLNPGKS